MTDEGRRRPAYEAFGTYLRNQRHLAQLTLRQLSELSNVSNPYLSQIERGLHQPSVAVIRSIADALNLSAEGLLSQLASMEGTPGDDDRRAQPGAPSATEAAVRADPRLTAAQKSALLAVYRSMIDDSRTGPEDNATR